MSDSPWGSSRGTLQRQTSWRRCQSVANSSPAPEFPANREKYREYPSNSGFPPDFRPNSVCTFGHLRENSLRTRTGNFLSPNRELIRENREFEPPNRERRKAVSASQNSSASTAGRSPISPDTEESPPFCDDRQPVCLCADSQDRTAAVRIFEELRSGRHRSKDRRNFTGFRARAVAAMGSSRRAPHRSPRRGWSRTWHENG